MEGVYVLIFTFSRTACTFFLCMWNMFCTHLTLFFNNVKKHCFWTTQTFLNYSIFWTYKYVWTYWHIFLNRLIHLSKSFQFHMNFFYFCRVPISTSIALFMRASTWIRDSSNCFFSVFRQYIVSRNLLSREFRNEVFGSSCHSKNLHSTPWHCIELSKQWKDIPEKLVPKRTARTHLWFL